MEEVTRIVITHKLSPELLRLYDQIIFMDDGKIVENGTYGELTTDYLYLTKENR